MFKLLKIDTPDFFYEEQNGKNYYVFIHKAIKKSIVKNTAQD